MTTTQLRRYEIVPGEMDAFVDWWHGLIGPRTAYGFRIAFAYADEEHNQFVWAVEHDGDFDAAEAEYMASPERAAAFEGVPKRVASSKVSKVTKVA